MALSSNGIGHLIFTQDNTGSNPVGVTNLSGFKSL